MTLVAVAPTKFNRGVAPPGAVTTIDGVTAPHTYDWRGELGSTANTARVRPAFRVAPLAEALERVYRSDAHMVTYYVVGRDGRPLEQQPRVNKAGLGWVLEQGYTLEHDLLMVDVDNPLHREWTPALRARLDELLANAAVLRTAGIYLTRAGYRLIQPLDEPVVASEVERYLASWIGELAAEGIEVDSSCVDWTRLFRLPHVQRGPVAYRSPLVDLSRMVPRRIVPKGSAGPSGRRVAERSAAA